MRTKYYLTALLSIVPGLAAPFRLTSGPKEVKIDNGSVLKVEAGELDVAESRRRPTARRVSIPYYRLRSESLTPASPIFLLAGGPGSSWLDQVEWDETYREVAFYRAIADVVLFDQRGGGRSRPSMECPQKMHLPAGQPPDPDALRAALRSAVMACRDQWLREAVDLAAYNTVENAADVNDLRLALGYKKVTLIGGSYGSHLALQFMRQYPEAVDRVVMYGVEGPDHTWDSPSGILATLGRLAAEAEQAPELAPHIPAGGLLKTLERVLARLESSPPTVTVTRGENSAKVVVCADLVRRIARVGAGRRGTPNAWPDLILALDRGDFSLAVRGALDDRNIGLARPMHYSMNCASGISEKRRRQYRDDPAAALLGDINFEHEAVCPVWPSEDLGESFRANVTSDIPAVMFHGTLDTSTPIENAREVLAFLQNGQLVEVTGGNHGAIYNLYERWPPMHPMLRDFLSGKSVAFPKSVVDTREVKFRAPQPLKLPNP